jgi:5'-3' exonuclease
MIVHLIDGTYELFRHFYGLRRFKSGPPRDGVPRGESKGKDAPYGAVIGVLRTVLQMIEAGATHIGVATDHVIESFRNDLWDGYKTGAGIEPALWRQFHPLEEALTAMGVVVWPMVELEADDALASAARLADADPRVAKVCIWTPDKDLGQAVRGDRVVQLVRKGGDQIRDEAAVRAKFGVPPELIPDLLALVGDAADGYPGIPGIGGTTAARLLNRHGPIESFPPEALGERRELALLFKGLATLRADAPLFEDVDELRWRGPTDGFAAWTERMQDGRLLERSLKAWRAQTQDQHPE